MTKSNWVAVIAVIVAIAAVITMGIMLKTKEGKITSLQTELFEEKAQFEQLEYGLARAESEVVTQKELNQAMKATFDEQLASVQQDLADLQAQPAEVVYVTTTIEGDTQVIEDTDFPPEYKFKTKDGMSVAHYLYEDRTFTAETYDLSATTGVLVSEDKNGLKVAHVVAHMSSSDPEDTDTYPLEITDAVLSFEKPTKNSLFFQPHLSGGIAAGYNFSNQAGELDAIITVSLLSVGSTRNDSTVYLLGLSGAFDSSSIGGGITPIQYNIGDPLPLLSDVYLGPTVIYGTDGWSLIGSVQSTF